MGFEEKLEYKTQVIYLDIIENDGLISDKINGINIQEIYNLDPTYHGRYQLLLSKNIYSSKELSENIGHIRKMCSKINLLLIYIIGYPFDRSINDMYGVKNQLIPWGKSDGWQSNFKELNKKLHHIENPDGFFIEVDHGDVRTWSTVIKSPLNELLAIYDKSSSLPMLYKYLIHFHSLTLKNEFLTRYLLMGKTLEIAREILPFPNDLKKSFQALPDDLKKLFKGKDLNWLYSMSNSRIETRHAINKKSDTLLHSEMTDEEYECFLLLSDNLIANIVRMELGLEPRVWSFGDEPMQDTNLAEVRPEVN